MTGRDPELGAMWHGCGWSTHTILFSDPLSGVPDQERLFGYSDGWPPQTSKTGWQWAHRPPRRWEPRFSRTKNGPTVTFQTQSGLGRDAIYRHVDVYPTDGQLISRSSRTRLAEGPGGFVF